MLLSVSDTILSASGFSPKYIYGNTDTNFLFRRSVSNAQESPNRQNHFHHRKYLQQRWMRHVKQYASEYKQQLSFCAIDFKETAPGEGRGPFLTPIQLGVLIGKNVSSTSAHETSHDFWDKIKGNIWRQLCLAQKEALRIALGVIFSLNHGCEI